MHERNRKLEVSERLVPAVLLLKAAALAAQGPGPERLLAKMTSSARPMPFTSGW